MKDKHDALTGMCCRTCTFFSTDLDAFCGGGGMEEWRRMEERKNEDAWHPFWRDSLLGLLFLFPDERGVISLCGQLATKVFREDEVPGSS